MNEKEATINWIGGLERKQFADIGIERFNDIWNLEHHESGLLVNKLREHSERFSGVVNRKTISIEVAGFEFFLKRSSGKCFESILTEFEATKIIPQFDVTVPKCVAFGFDYEKRRGFVLLKKLAGYYSLKELANYKAPTMVTADFQQKKRFFLEKLIKFFYLVKKEKYFYPDWRDKHIFFNMNTSDFAIIDLERFRHVSKCPWYYLFPFVRRWKKEKELKTLRHALGKKFYTKKTIKEILDQAEQSATGK